MACRHVVVFARDQSRRLLDDGHFGAEAPEHLRELEADVAAAHDDEVLRDVVERQHRRVREIRHVMNAAEVGNRVRVRRH